MEYPLEIEKAAVTTVGCFTCTIAFLYILMKKLYCKPSGIVFTNLILADLAFIMYSMPQEYKLYIFYTNNRINYLWYPFATLLFIDMWAIFPITFDRLTAVMQPLSYGHSSHRNKILLWIGICWLFPTLYVVVTGAAKFADKRIGFFVATSIFGFLPLVANVFTFGEVIKYLVRARSSKNSKANKRGDGELMITVTKALLTIILFTCSWLYWFIGKIVLRKGHDSLMDIALYFNCITDPLLYLIPNKVLRRLFTQINPLNMKSDPVSIEYSKHDQKDNNGGITQPDSCIFNNNFQVVIEST